ncbi:MAG: flagellar basal body rod protein FlgF [Gammaproteobacteria bacterium]|nr:flagellar basal body rod protein FlgF [Pseudomonadales bacterium]MCP5349025.1 flagellar basal body rod protein FlgF [Pseudomonadales bacterium]
MSQVYVTAMENARQIMLAQAVNANNLANASTDGFRAELSYLMDTEEGRQAFSTPDLSAGYVRSTGRNLDVAVKGDGWIAIQGPDGTEAYSRRGDLQVDVFGQLTNGAGRPVLGNNGPIALPPFANIEIAGDGTLSIQPLGQPANTLAVIDRIKLVELDPTRVQRGEDGLMHLPDGETAVASATTQLVSGSLEGSNVNAVEEMVKMIDLARRFEAQIQLMRSEDENSASLAELMNFS